jgi:hypothetical protein
MMHNVGDCCPCQGLGWVLFGEDYSPCRIHFCGQIHPQVRSLLLDDLPTLREEERKSKIYWEIKEKRKQLALLLLQSKSLQLEINNLENNLYVATPTTKIRKSNLNKLILNLNV